MALISDLPPEERDLIFSLPYKVGIWVSHAADEGGEDDDTKEMKELEQLLTHMAEEIHIPPIARQVCQGALDRRDQWEIWENNALRVPAECTQALDILRPIWPEKDLKNLRVALMKIAVSVAEAHGEFNMYDDEDEEEGWAGFFGRVKDALSGMGGAQETKADNISPAEQEALNQLSAALTVE